MTQSATWTANTRAVAASDWPGGEFMEAMRLYHARKSYEGVVVLGSRVAFFYGLMCRFFGKSVPWLTKELLLGGTGTFRAGGLKSRLQSWALGTCDVFALYSEAERRQCVVELGLPETHCVFLPFHTRREPSAAPVSGDGSFLAAGRSLRDYAVLAEALRLSPMPVRVVAPASERKHFEGVRGVEFLGELPGERYRKQLEVCSAVVIPLGDTRRSAGQAVLLEAMSLGKPVLMADVASVRGYVEPESEALLYRPGDAADLARQMRRLRDEPGLADRLGRAAWEKARSCYTPEHHAQRVIQLLRNGSRAS